MEAKNLADLYDLPLVKWDRIEEVLDQGFTQAPGTGGPNRHTCWLTTINPDGSPHVTGVGGAWVDGAFWFITAETSRKGRNVSHDPRCTLSLATNEFDLVLEGDAHQITDRAQVAKLAQISADGGWPAKVDDSGTALTAEYSAPSAGPPPWHVYRITARSATALSIEEPGGATRWKF